MPYSTLTDIENLIEEDELIQLTDDDGTGAVDTDIIDNAVADADAEIDSYCMERYTVPFSSVPVMIKKLSVDIAVYNLFSRKQGAPEDRAKRYQDAIAFLKDVAKGTASLGADAPVETSQDTIMVTHSKDDRVFTRGQASKGTVGTLDNY
jgi:phage gp36-like protein